MRGLMRGIAKLLWVFTVALLVLCPESRASCVTGSTSTVLAPAVSYLRAYRASFHAPTRLAVDGSGNVYVTDPIKGEILVRASDGRIVGRKKNLGHPISVAIDAAGRIYVGDGERGSVRVFSSSWQELRALGQGTGEFLMPNDIAIDPATGNVYVSDGKFHTVKIFGPSGDLLSSFGGLGSGDGQFNFPAGIFVDSGGGELLVADQLNYRIQIFDLAGNFRFCFGSQGRDAGKFNGPQGIAEDSSGRIYVTDLFEGRIQVLDRGGNFIGYIGDFGKQAGRLRVPTDLVIDPSSRLFVASANNSRIEMYGLDSFSDPERVVPAAVEIQPDAIDPTVAAEPIVAYVEIPGARLDAVDRTTITANGVPASSTPITAGDHDGDAEPDLRVEFDRGAVLSTLPPDGDADVTVTGTIGSMQFEGSDRVVVLHVERDSDGDGVLDEDDACPGTSPEAAVDEQGCSIDQLCPCDASMAGEPWRNHGDYVSCVSHAADDFRAAGRIDQEQPGTIVNEAAKSRCGK